MHIELASLSSRQCSGISNRLHDARNLCSFNCHHCCFRWCI